MRSDVLRWVTLSLLAVGVLVGSAAGLRAVLGPVGAVVVIVFTVVPVGFVALVVVVLTDRTPSRPPPPDYRQAPARGALDVARQDALVELADAYVNWRATHPDRHSQPRNH